MSKYEPLSHFLRAQGKQRIPMTFAEIERVIKAKLPATKMQRAFWSNNAANNVMTKHWLDAGYKTQNVDLRRKNVVFAKSPSRKSEATADEWWDQLYGSMKGMLTVAPGFDATAPAFDPDEWNMEAYPTAEGK